MAGVSFEARGASGGEVICDGETAVWMGEYISPAVYSSSIPAARNVSSSEHRGDESRLDIQHGDLGAGYDDPGWERGARPRWRAARSHRSVTLPAHTANVSREISCL